MDKTRGNEGRPDVAIAEIPGPHDLLQRLAGEALPSVDGLTASVRPVRLQAGEAAFIAGVEHPYCYVLVQGLVKLVYVQPNGREAIKSLLLEGDLFGSVRALEPGGRTSFAAIALEDCHAWRIAFAALEAAAARHPAWQRLLTRAFRQLAWRKEERERELLTLTPAQRYARLLETRPAIAARVSQADLALFLGITPVSLSRIRGRLGLTRRAGPHRDDR